MGRKEIIMRNSSIVALIMVVLVSGPMTAVCGESPANHEDEILKIKVMANGDIYADDVKVDLPKLALVLDQLKTSNGKVWYYRERGTTEAPAAVMQVIKAIADRELPTSFSSQPDFSDYIDSSGTPHPRN